MALPGRPILNAIVGGFKHGFPRIRDFLIQKGGTVRNEDGTVDTTPKGVLRSKSIIAILFLAAQDAFTFNWEQLDFSNRAATWQTATMLWLRFGAYIGAIWWRITSTTPTTGPAEPGAA